MNITIITNIGQRISRGDMARCSISDVITARMRTIIRIIRREFLLEVFLLLDATLYLVIVITLYFLTPPGVLTDTTSPSFEFINDIPMGQR